MNVYDFDGTIYEGDSTVDFWRFCIKKYPKAFCALPEAVLFGVMNQLGICKKSLFKEKFYGFLKYVPNIQKEIQIFWDVHMEYIKDFYRTQRLADDLIISASPHFLISEACTRLGVKCIAPKVNLLTGKLEGPNCYGEEKLRVFREVYPQAYIEKFYTDSRSDIFLAKEARQAFLVKKDAIQEWSV